MDNKYTKEEIQLAIDMCKKYTIENKTPPMIDGDLDCEIETIEWKYFLVRLDRIKSNISTVTHNNLRLFAKVIDSEQNTGIITSIMDKHNVEVEFDNGGAGFWCFVEGCDEFTKDSKDVLYYY